MKILLPFLFACGGASPVPEATRCEIPATALDSWRLVADCTSLRDAAGRLVFLRGMNTGGRSKFAPFFPFAFEGDSDFDAALDAYWDRMAAWGFSVARLVFTWEAVEPAPGAYDEAFLSRYDAMIDAAWARGIRVVVDFHQDVYARMYCGDGFPEWTIPDALRETPPDDCSAWFSGYLMNDHVRAAFDRFWTNEDGLQDAYFAMFDRMVERYADRPGVIGFEAMNEPGWGTAGMQDWERETFGPFFVTFAERVRAAAPEALVFLDATSLDGLSASTALEDPGVPGTVFAPHDYDPSTSLTGEYVADGSVREAVGTWASLGAEWDVPVFLGEFGVSGSTIGAREFLRDHMSALDDLGMSGTAWEYSVSGELWSAEDFSLVDGDGAERPGHVDGLVRPTLRAAAGRDVTVRYDAEERVFVASVVPDAAGVTEVALPDRVYPEGVRVGLTGGCVDVDPENRVVRLRADADATTLEVDLRPIE